MKQLLLAVTMLSTFGCMAQVAPVAVKNAFTQHFPGITVKKWDKEDGKYEANFTKDGKTMSALFDANGTLEETETDIPISQLPAAVVAYVQSNYKGATIKEAALIVRGTAKLYEAEVKGKDLLFNEQGTFVKEESDND